MKSYEEFSPEAKQAIEQFRKFTSKLKSDQIGPGANGEPHWILFEENYPQTFEKIIYYGAFMFGVKSSEANDIWLFAYNKQYWISKEVIANCK